MIHVIKHDMDPNSNIKLSQKNWPYVTVGYFEKSVRTQWDEIAFEVAFLFLFFCFFLGFYK